MGLLPAMAEGLVLRGTTRAHTDMVTAIDDSDKPITSTARPTPTPPSSHETARVSAVAAAHASPILPSPPVARAFIGKVYKGTFCQIAKFLAPLLCSGSKRRNMMECSGSKRRNMMEWKSLGLFMLLFILLASQEMVVPAEASHWVRCHSYPNCTLLQGVDQYCTTNCYSDHPQCLAAHCKRGYCMCKIP